MSLNLIRFELRLNRLSLIVVSLSLAVFQFLLVAFFAAARPDQNLAGFFDSLPPFLQAIIGDGYANVLTVQGFLAFGFTHPLVLILLSAGALTLSSRTATGGAESGITDLMLSQPVPRYFVILSRAAAGEAAGLVMVLALWLGHWIGVTLLELPAEPPRIPYIYVVVNAYAFFLAVQGMGFLAAVLCRRRGKAVGISLGVLAVMLFLKFCAQLWSTFDGPAHLSFLYYYEPGKVVIQGAFPWVDILILLGYYLVTLGAAVWVFSKRDI